MHMRMHLRSREGDRSDDNARVVGGPARGTARRAVFMAHGRGPTRRSGCSLPASANLVALALVGVAFARGQRHMAGLALLVRRGEGDPTAAHRMHLPPLPLGPFSLSPPPNSS